LLELYRLLKNIAETEYKDIVVKTAFIHKRTIGSTKLRIFIKDPSFLDIWLSETGKYSYHWEQRAQRGQIYRHDNAPDFPEIETYPKHLHDSDDKNVKASNLPNDPQTAIKQILDYIRNF